MIAIKDVLISDDIVKRHFVCNLTACKGACCWKGDFGAPVTNKECEQISDSLEGIVTLLPAAARELIANEGFIDRYDTDRFIGTKLLSNGSCVFMTTSASGCASCGIEQAQRQGLSHSPKPSSCHLYPIRVTKNQQSGFEAWNYDRWDICSAACELGNKLQVPLYLFLKEAIISYKGKSFFDELEAAASYLENEL